MLFSSSRGPTGADRFSWSHFLVLLMGNLIKNLPVAAGSLSKPLRPHHAKTSAIGSPNPPTNTSPVSHVTSVSPRPVMECLLHCHASAPLWPPFILKLPITRQQESGFKGQTGRHVCCWFPSLPGVHAYMVEASYGLRIFKKVSARLHKTWTQIRQNSKKAN